MLVPEVFEFVFQIELLTDARKETLVPLVGVEVLAEGSQVGDGDADSRNLTAARTMSDDLPTCRDVRM